MEYKKIRAFTDLIAWQEGHKLVLMIYKSTKVFPQNETYSLINQMNRCAVSITSNIAEGFSRNSGKEKKQFYFMSLGSTTELQNQLIIAKDLEYVSRQEYQVMFDQTIKVHKLLNGLIKSSVSILNT